MNSPYRGKADDALNVQNIERKAREALVCGDRTAVIKVLMHGYGDRIYRLCLNTLADPSDASDALQHVFTTAFEYMDSFEGMSHFLPWLRKIATQHCINVLDRNDRANDIFVVRDRLPDDADPRPSGDEALTYQWLIGEVELCLDELPSHDRLMLTLRFLEGLTYPEMAEHLEMPVSTARLRVNRALVAIRRSLTAREICP